MAKNLTDLTARTATADSDLLHINSGGSDYKQTKARFCNDIVQYIDFANTSSLTGQCDTLGSTVKSPAYFAGKINSYGHQSACGTPENNSYHVLLSIYSGNYHELTITDVDTGAIWRKLKINGTWQSSWVMSPTRNEITSLNNSLTKSSGTITKGNFGSMLYATCTKVAGIVTFSFWINIATTEPTVSGEQTIAILPSGFRPSQIISCGVGMTKFPEGAYAYVQANGAVIVSASMINVHPTMLISGSFAV